MLPTDRKNRKRRAGTFEWHQANASADNQERPTVRRKHTDISINMAGPSSTQNSYITAPASPVKSQLSEPIYRDDYLLHQMGLEIEDELAGPFDGVEDKEVEDEDEGEELEEDMDPQYQRHLNDNVVDGGIAGIRRKRTPAVIMLYQTHLLLVLTPQPSTRITHCASGYPSATTSS